MNDIKQETIDTVLANLVTTREAMELLGCSRQNLDDLIKRGKLTPVKKWDRDKLLWKPDLLARMNKPSE